MANTAATNNRTARRVTKATTISSRKSELPFNGDLKSPPTGYTFVPKGNVYITRNCRIQTRLANKVLYTVKDPSTSQPQGLLCPAEILKSVHRLASETAARRTSAVVVRDLRLRKDARKTLLGMYPSMPTQDLERVLDHGFEKGSRRVGRSTRLDEESRAMLAVQAHVRHAHTEYDALLRKQKATSGNLVAKGNLEFIRRKVLPQCNILLAEWRGSASKQSPKRRISQTLPQVPARPKNGDPKGGPKIVRRNRTKKKPARRRRSVFLKKRSN